MIKIRTGKAMTLGAVALLAAMTVPALAGVPRKQPLGRYADLWSKSPFTVPPTVVNEPEEEENPLEEFTLAGVCKMKKGWFVVLMNKKKRDERVRIRPGESNDEGFQIVSVQDGKGHMETKVEIKTRGGKTGWVEYDKKFIAVRKAVAKAPAGKPGVRQPPVPTRPGMPARPTTTSGRSTPPVPTGSTSGRPSRVRRIPNPPSR